AFRIAGRAVACHIAPTHEVIDTPFGRHSGRVGVARAMMTTGRPRGNVWPARRAGACAATIAWHDRTAVDGFPGEAAMPYVPVPTDQPGIRGLLAFKPASGVFVARMIHQLLRGDSPLSAADRERIAAFVSEANDCEFCARSHAAAIHHLERASHASAVPAQRGDEPSPLLAALLDIAAAVVRGGHFVTDEKIAAARAAGADDET